MVAGGDHAAREVDGLRRVSALAVGVRPRLGGRDQGGGAAEVAVVEDDQTEAQLPLHEVVSGKNVSVEFAGRQDVQVELTGKVASEQLRPDEVVVEIADRRTPRSSR